MLYPSCSRDRCFDGDWANRPLDEAGVPACPRTCWQAGACAHPAEVANDNNRNASRPRRIHASPERSVGSATATVYVFRHGEEKPPPRVPPLDLMRRRRMPRQIRRAQAATLRQKRRVVPIPLVSCADVLRGDLTLSLPVDRNRIARASAGHREEHSVSNSIRESSLMRHSSSFYLLAAPYLPATLFSRKSAMGPAPEAELRGERARAHGRRRGAFAGRNRLQPGHGSGRSRNQTQIAVGMRRHFVVDRTARSHRNAARTVEIKVIPGRTHRTEPEKLRLCRAPFVRIEVAGTQCLEFHAAMRITAAIDHRSEPRTLMLPRSGVPRCDANHVCFSGQLTRYAKHSAKCRTQTSGRICS